MTEIAMKRETEQQNELLLLQIEKENLQMTADRMARHDRRHHNLVLLELANQNDIENVKDRISDLEDRLEQIEARYWKQFTAMEKAIEKANSQYSYLTQYFGQSQ